MSMDKTEWFLAQFKPNHDQIALRHLHRQGFETFLPLQEETRRVRGRFTNRLRPLFPGYLFVGFDPSFGGWRAIHSTQGISKLVCVGQAPAPVPKEIVTALQVRCDAAGKLLTTPALKSGDSVVLKTGPFADFVASIEHVAPDQRLYLLLDLMGRQVRIKADIAQVQTV